MVTLRMSLPREWAVVYCLASVFPPLLHTGTALAQAREPLELVQTIALPDVRGRIDHLDIDLDGERLFVAAWGISFLVYRVMDYESRTPEAA